MPLTLRWRSAALALVPGLILAISACAAPSGNARLDSVEASGDGTLRIGLILDNTGESAFLNPSQLAAAKLAVAQINAAGGHKGQPVELLPADVGADAAEFTRDAGAQARSLLDARADVVIGPSDSSHAPAVIDVLSRAKVPVISPANTATVLSGYKSGGYYFRTAAADSAQGSVLAKLAHEGGAGRLAVMHEDTGYGKDVAVAVADAARRLGLEVLPTAGFAEGKAGSAVAAFKDAAPDAVVVVARRGAQAALAELLNAGISGKKLLLSDGAVRQYGGELGARGLDGARGVLPGVFPGTDFQNALVGTDPGLKDLTFAAEAFDAVNLAAVAAAAAEDDGGASIAALLTTVSGGVRPQDAGTEERAACGSYRACMEVLEAGKTPDYEGESGAIGFDANGDITSANYMVFGYGPDNRATMEGKETATRAPAS
ncbi:ABC transporter substrate-binding protein [Arthrobacter cupressi]|uniref:Branched-chain amino acid transport system substrate-binding protein n=1 Tax=Arthrobacter cupressi TaxID=1045773 RepID=A0A1G8HWT6_9MICC|nr:ABC transporter substrate-binding protein [Arthrobacter cupressi]NYD78833.1 branched-chain amino acid transport system substrate-binding protein [Arthrobacter cupressi]SDI11185.1 branched-chain amino acid transport system substrate-binding protein [Arthrobacter cupressi]